MRSQAQLKPNADGTLTFYSSYDPGLVAGIKTEIPAEGRKFDGQRKVWVVAAQYGPVCAQLALDHLGVKICVPTVVSNTLPETRVFAVLYVGATKDRGNGDRSAFGFVDGDWSVIFPERALRRWFEFDDSGEPVPTESSTLYAILGVKRDATPEDIKRAYRRMAKQWHPDVFREPGAKERFQRIGEANTVLSDLTARKRYDVGLALAGSVQHSAGKWPVLDNPDVYRPALRCGYVCAEGQMIVGRFVVGTILAWEDIVGSTGRTLVTSWPPGAVKFEEMWV